MDTQRCIEYISDALSQQGCAYAHLLMISGVIESMKESDLRTISQCAGSSWSSVLYTTLTNIREGLIATKVQESTESVGSLAVCEVCVCVRITCI